jgi:hypothetical protein
MELWQLDVVHGLLLADETSAKALTGIDDHSRFCIPARLMVSERTSKPDHPEPWRWPDLTGRADPRVRDLVGTFDAPIRRGSFIIVE